MATTEHSQRPRVDLGRLWTDLETLATFTDPARPYTRRSFTQTYTAGRKWLAARMEDAGLTVSIDAGGNLIGRWEGADPHLSPLMAGSHTDTVVGGGRFDGTVGVMGALEAVRALRDAGIRLHHPVEVVDFLAEEPTDYGVSCVGSQALATGLDPTVLAQTDPAGETLADGLRRMGGDPARVIRPLRQPGSVAAYVELHIEQGPILHRRGIPIGVVTGIASMEWHHITIRGRAGHAGTTPMDQRQDALADAAAIILEVERIARDHAAQGPFVATVGRLRAEPNNANVIASRVTLTVDVRSHDEARLAAGWDHMAQAIDAICRDRGLTWEEHLAGRARGATADPVVMQAIEQAAEALGYRTLRLPSGAGHDAMYMARIVPMGMIFIPCRDGLSHRPDEWVDPSDVARGAEVLAHTLQILDRQFLPGRQLLMGDDG